MFRLSLLRLWCLIIAIAFAANTARGQQVSKEEQEVLNASAARREAYNHRDLVALNRYISDDGLVSTDDGALVTKADLMRHLKDLPPNYEQISNAREFASGCRAAQQSSAFLRPPASNSATQTS